MELSEEINTLSRLIKSAFIRIEKTNLSFTEDFDKQKIKELYAFKKKKKADVFLKNFLNYFCNFLNSTQTLLYAFFLSISFTEFLKLS